MLLESMNLCIFQSLYDILWALNVDDNNSSNEKKKKTLDERQKKRIGLIGFMNMSMGFVVALQCTRWFDLGIGYFVKPTNNLDCEYVNGIVIYELDSMHMICLSHTERYVRRASNQTASARKSNAIRESNVKY